MADRLPVCRSDLTEVLSAAGGETEVDTDRFSYTSFFVLWHGREPFEGEAYSLLRGEEFTTHYDLIDHDARVMLAFSLRRQADALLAEVPRTLVEERYPSGCVERAPFDVPLF